MQVFPSPYLNNTLISTNWFDKNPFHIISKGYVFAPPPIFETYLAKIVPKIQQLQEFFLKTLKSPTLVLINHFLFCERAPPDVRDPFCPPLQSRQASYAYDKCIPCFVKFAYK